MGGCAPFTIEVRGDMKKLLARLRKMAAEDGMTFKGNLDSGTFSGKGVSGTYSVSGQTATITVTEKPWIVPCSIIESKMRGFFE